MTVYLSDLLSLTLINNPIRVNYCIFGCLAFDKDSSGAIDFHEFLIAFNVLSSGDINARLDWIFDVYDQNKDKAIDRKEMIQLVKVRINHLVFFYAYSKKA